jgi:hypothetical protein
MSYREPTVSGFEVAPSEMDPKHYGVIPADAQQDVAFRSIRAITPESLKPFGVATLVPTRRTPKGIRPMIWIRLNETGSAIAFDVTLHTGQCIQVHVPLESWRLGTCTPENVRAAIQKAYLNLLRRKVDPVIVKPGMISLKVLSDPKHTPPHQTHRHSSSTTTTRQNSFESNTTQDSSRYSSSKRTQSTRYSSPNNGHRHQGYYDPYTGYTIQYEHTRT